MKNEEQKDKKKKQKHKTQNKKQKTKNKKQNILKISKTVSVMSNSLLRLPLVRPSPSKLPKWSRK